MEITAGTKRTKTEYKILKVYNIDNLIPNCERTHEELAEMGRKGGIISGQVRREKAEQRKRAKLLLSITLDILKDEKKAKTSKKRKRKATVKPGKIKTVERGTKPERTERNCKNTTTV